jgi:hypothetical protein
MASEAEERTLLISWRREVDAKVRAIKRDCWHLQLQPVLGDIGAGRPTLVVFRVYALAARKQSCVEGIVSRE